MSVLRWPDRLKGTKRLVNYGEERSIVCDYTHEKKISEGFTQNGCCGYGFKVLMALAPAVPALLQNKIKLVLQVYLSFCGINQSSQFNYDVHNDVKSDVKSAGRCRLLNR